MQFLIDKHNPSIVEYKKDMNYLEWSACTI